jgi:hypothetical protein
MTAPTLVPITKREAQWVELDEMPILFANHFLVQPQPHEFVLTLGQVIGPPLIGTPEEIAEQAREFGPAKIHPTCRVGITRHRLAELIGVLQGALRDHDRSFGED